MPATVRTWIGNASPVAQVQTYKPGKQPPNTTITATVNGKSVSYLSVNGTNDDLIAGLITALNSATAQELREITWSALVDVPAIASPNSKTLQMKSATAGVPFTATIALTTPPTVKVARITTGRPGENERQMITIGPNGQSGTFTVTWDGEITGNIPLPPQPPTVAAAAGSALGSASADSTYKYAVTFLTADGETEAGAPASLLVAQNTTANGSLTAIPTGPGVVTGRRIYRTKANGSTFYLLTTLNDNSTTTYSDSTADASLGEKTAPATNFALEGAVQALSNVGAGNFKVGGVNLPAVPTTDPTKQVVPQPFVYICEFVNDLGAASQPLMTGDVAGVTVLPTITIEELQAGCPIQSAIHRVGWRQVVGEATPTGNFLLTLPGLGATTAPIDVDATEEEVLDAIRAAVPPAYAGAFAVTAGDADANGYTWDITYQGLLANRPVQQCQVDIAGMSPALEDTLTPVQEEVQIGSATGQDAAVLVTINNNPTSGTWYLAAVDATSGATLATSSAIANNPTAAQVETALGGASLAAVSGPTGGPFEVNFVGSLGSRKLNVLWASNLTGGGAAAGSPPASNTTGLPTPGQPYIDHRLGGALHSGVTYYYKITAYNAAGETLPSQEASAFEDIGEHHLLYRIVWTAIPGATGYKIYRGITSGGENILVANVNSGSQTEFWDGGSGTTAGSPPGSDGSGGLDVPVLSQLGPLYEGNSGTSDATTYYYKITAYNGTGETTASNEVSVAVPAHSRIAFGFWYGVTGATGYKIYRGITSGGENILVANLQYNNPGAQMGFVDSVGAGTSATPPASNTTGISAPVQNDTTPSASGGSLVSDTYYYIITATDANGETTASNEKSAVVTGPAGSVALSWNIVSGATGYRIYRGTSAGDENLLVAQLSGGSTNSYTDVGSGVAASLSIAEIAVGAAAVNEQQTITIAGATGGTYRLAVNGNETSNLTFNDVAAIVQDALEAILGEGNIVAAGSAGGPYTLTFQGDLAGKSQPLLVSLASGLIGSITSAQSLVTVTSATGQNHWDNAANWSPAGVPVDGDSAVFANSNIPCLYGLDQSEVTLLNLTVDMSYSGGKIGLPAWNGKYYEYREQYLQIGVSGDITIGNGKGSGPSLVKLDTGTVAASILVNNVGNSSDPSLPPIIWKGNRASGSTVINLNKGKMAIAPFIGETATVDTIRQNYISNKASDTYLYVGGGATIATWSKNGGDADCYASITTLTHEEGTFSLYDSAGVPSTVGTLGLLGGSFFHAATGTITTLSVGTSALYDRTEDSRPVTITDTKIYGKSSFVDPHGSVTFTNAYQLIGCGYPDLVKFDVGASITGTRTKVSF